MTVQSLITDRLIELRIDPSEISEPERQLLMERVRQEALTAIQEVKVDGVPRKIICESQVRDYPLPNAQTITAVAFNGRIITDQRAHSSETFATENRSSNVVAS